MLVALLRRTDAEGSGADPATFKDVSIPDASDDDAADKHPRAALPDVVISRTCVLSARAWFLATGPVTSRRQRGEGALYQLAGRASADEKTQRQKGRCRAGFQ
jgi:hypothetical protein